MNHPKLLETAYGLSQKGMEVAGLPRPCAPILFLHVNHIRYIR